MMNYTEDSEGIPCRMEHSEVLDSINKKVQVEPNNLTMWLKDPGSDNWVVPFYGAWNSLPWWRLFSTCSAVVNFQVWCNEEVWAGHLISKKGQTKRSPSSFNNPSLRTARFDWFAVAYWIICSGDVPVFVSIEPGEEKSPEDLGAPPTRCINGRYHFVVRIGREVAVVVGDLPKAAWC